MKRWLGIAIAICVTLSLIAIPFSGCAGPAPTTPTPTTPTPTPTTPTPTEEPGPKSGGVLKIGNRLTPPQLGVPALLYTSNYWSIVYTCIEMLGVYNKEGGFEPGLATAWEEDAEAATITVTLKEGVKFHDGTPFNAEAVKWNFENYKALGGISYWLNVESVDVIDDYTVRFNYPEYKATNMLRDLSAWIVSPTAFKTHGQEWCETHPVGTGPFKFVSWQKDVLIKFERFDDYWGGRPYLDGVEWVSFPDPTVEIASLLAGEIDAINDVDPKDAKSLEESGEYTLVQAVGDPQVFWPDSDNEDSPWSKLKVRQAMNYAIDRQAIADAIGYGYWKPVMQWGFPGRWDYSPDVVGYTYNPEKARQLLAEAGYPDGFETTINRLNTPASYVAMATAVQGYLAEVGIDADIKLIESALEGEWWYSGGWDGLWNSWLQTSVALELFVRELIFCQPNILGGIEVGIIKPKEYVDLLDQILKEPDFETRKAMMHRLTVLEVDKYCMYCMSIQSTRLFVKSPELHDDGLYEITFFGWTPATAWFDR